MIDVGAIVPQPVDRRGVGGADARVGIDGNGAIDFGRLERPHIGEFGLDVLALGRLGRIEMGADHRRVESAHRRRAGIRAADLEGGELVTGAGPAGVNARVEVGDFGRVGADEEMIETGVIELDRGDLVGGRNRRHCCQRARREQGAQQISNSHDFDAGYYPSRAMGKVQLL